MKPPTDKLSVHKGKIQHVAILVTLSSFFERQGPRDTRQSFSHQRALLETENDRSFENETAN